MSNLSARILLTCTVAMAAVPAHAQDALEELARLIPGDALAVVASPNLRAASDHLAQTMEAMDRSHLLMGSTPLEQTKAAMGFAIGIDDMGGAAIALIPSVASEQAGPARGIINPGNVVAIFALSDEDAFFRGNFRSGRKHGHHDQVRVLEHARVGTLHARSFDGYVALSQSAVALAQMTRVEKGEGFDRLLDQRSRALARRGHVFLWLRGDLQRTGRALPRQYAHLRAAIPDWREFEHTLVSVTFDALGFFVRSNTTLEPGSAFNTALDRLQAAPQQSDGPPLQLPDEPFILAASFRGIAAPTTNQSQDEPAPYSIWFNLLQDIEAFELGWYSPNETRPDAGDGNAFLVVRGGKATSRRALVEQFLKPDGKRWSLDWSRDIAVGENGMRADAFQLSRERQHLLDALLDFHLGPQSGYVSDLDAATVMTFDKNAAALEFARSSIQSGAPPLRQNHIVAAMRDWMPRGRFFEAYLDLGELAAHGRELFLNLPAFAQGAPPVGFGLAAHDEGAQSMVILPREVLAPIIDEAVSSLLERVRRRTRDEAGQP